MEQIKEELPEPILLEDLGRMFTTESSNKKTRFGIYKCGFCGTNFKANTYRINRGDIKSCGCLKEKISKEGRNRKHNLTNTRLYNTWSKLKNRVFNLKSKDYYNYGGRGITICDEWKNDFKSFYDWAMKNEYSDELSIDRIDNDGNYCPENCRWTTRTIQQRNQRMQKNNKSGFKGVCLVKGRNKYIAQICVDKKIKKLGYFQTVIEGAIAYNNYIIENNLEGFILNEIPTKCL